MLVAIPLLLYNCETDEFFQEPQLNLKEMSFTTVSINDAKQLFNSYVSSIGTLSYARNETPLLEINPNWETVIQSNLDFTDALLTNLEADINRDGNYKTKLFFLTINDSTLQALETEYATERFENGAIKTGTVYYNSLSGDFLDAYMISNGLTSKRLLPNPPTNQAGIFSFLSILIYQTDPGDCWNTDNLPVDGVLDEVMVHSSQPMSEFMKVYEGSGGFNPDGDSNNNNTSSGGSGGPDLNADPTTGECYEGYVYDPSLGICVEQETPCAGDPIPNPEIASSGSSGRGGGTFGCTRVDKTICGGVYGKRNHNGLDIKVAVNNNAYAMYSGTISSIRNSFAPGEYKKDSYGNFVVITTLINGNTYNIKYNHLNAVSVVQGQHIDIGDVIGLTGNTGNAADPDVIPHIHLQVFNSNWSQSLDPEDYLTTKFDSNYNPISNNCQ